MARGTSATLHMHEPSGPAGRLCKAALALTGSRFINSLSSSCSFKCSIITNKAVTLCLQLYNLAKCRHDLGFEEGRGVASRGCRGAEGRAGKFEAVLDVAVPAGMGLDAQIRNNPVGCVGTRSIPPPFATAVRKGEMGRARGRAVCLWARSLAIRKALAPCSDRTGKSFVSLLAASGGEGPGAEPPPRNAEQPESIIGSQGTAPGGTRAGNRSGRGEKRRSRWHSESGGERGDREEMGGKLEGKWCEPRASSAFGRCLWQQRAGGRWGVRGKRFLGTGTGAQCWGRGDVRQGPGGWQGWQRLYPTGKRTGLLKERLFFMMSLLF